MTDDHATDDPIAAFRDENARTIAGYPADAPWQEASDNWLDLAFRKRYMYHFAWLGRPIIQLPNDMVAMQEILWEVQPDLVIETGIAHGGSLVLSASILALLDLVDARGTAGDGVVRPRRQVLGVDIDIRAHNSVAITSHPLADWISMIEGPSLDPGVIEQVHAAAAGAERVMVVLDSNHTHDHVLAELGAYAPLASRGSYCVVFDTIVDDLPADVFPDRPWGPGDNPKTAVRAFLDGLASGSTVGIDGAPLRFEVDRTLDDKLMLSAAPGGFLRRL